MKTGMQQRESDWCPPTARRRRRHGNEEGHVESVWSFLVYNFLAPSLQILYDELMAIDIECDAIHRLICDSADAKTALSPVNK